MELWPSLTEPLLTWFSEHARPMPWRDDPTPYHVWISEIMLQQTRVSAVVSYYERFLSALPDVESLARCEDDRLMKLWQGLGYYSRARNLKKAARVIVDDYGGRFPDTYGAIRALPGVGDYTAGAICSIAFGLPEPAVDGNVLRVWSRITGSFSDITAASTKNICRNVVRSAMPHGRTSAYTQALMELGATVCLPNGEPLCDRCPVRTLCTAYGEGLVSQLPVKTPPKPRRIEDRTVFFLLHESRVALRKRPDRGLLSGLWEFPNILNGEDLPPFLDHAHAQADLGTGRHIFSHVEWNMTSAVFSADSDRLPDGYVWATAEELTDRYAVPTAFRDFFKPLLSRLRSGEKNG